MNQDEAFNLLSQGRFHAWNQFRESNPGWIPDLSNLDLTELNFVFGEDVLPDLSGTNFCGANLPPKYCFVWNGREVKLDGAMVDKNTNGIFDICQLGAKFVTEATQSQVDAAAQKTVFISYAWANQDVIVAIDQWLRQKSLNVKIDRRDFFAGSRIRDEIMRTMKDSDVVLIFYSNESRDKPWTQFEQELAADIEMEAKKEGKSPPRIIYVVIDDTPLPNVTESNKIAIMAKGKRFELVCEEIYHNILELPRSSDSVDLSKWSDYVF